MLLSLLSKKMNEESMFYESIKVLDCTIRDGGLVNKHDFSLEFVQRLYQLLNAAGVDYMEVGYKNSPGIFDPKEYGPWKFCEDDLLWKLKDSLENPKIKLAVMADVGRINLDAIKPASESPYEMVRIASYVKNIDKGIDLVNTFSDLGYETTLNIMAVSRDRGPELDEALDQVEKECKADVLYLVDSFGNFYQEDIDECVNRYRRHTQKTLGYHGHNNQQLAFSNTIQAIIKRVDYLDCSVSGMGRGAGNCTTELLLGFLKNPKFDIRPVLDAITELFLPLREKFEWGYIIPQMITGALNLHPKDAIEVRKTEDKDNYRKFYERMMNMD